MEPSVRTRPKRRSIPLLLPIAVVLFCLALGFRALFPAPVVDSPLPTAVPDWVKQDLLPVNEYSRPGTALDAVNGVVVHYVGNPGTTAAQNRSYFAGLALNHENYASSNFIVGLDGEVLLTVSVNEVAYCSNDRNSDTLSIEVCHPDDTGVFATPTYASLVKLVQWTVDAYDLKRDQVLRHYDITGKVCPKSFVDDPAAWDAFLDQLDFSKPAA